MEFKVSFVHQDRCVWRRLCYPHEFFLSSSGPGWIVGIRDCDETGGRSDVAENGVQWKRKVHTGGNIDNSRSRGCGEYAIHGKCRNDDYDLIVRLQVGFTYQVDRFIHAIGQQQFVGSYTQVARHDCLNWCALGIACQVFGFNGTQTLRYSRRATNRILVKVEPQPFSSGQRRMIGRKFAYCITRTKHGGTSREWNVRAPSTLRFLPGTRLSC